MVEVDIRSMAIAAAVGLAIVVTLMLFYHVFIKFWVLRRGASADADQERAAAADDGGGKGLSADELETLPCHDISSNGAASADCAVCLEAFEAGERCRRLPSCEHSFHAKCVDPWLRKSRCCPVCRADVVAERPKGELVKVAGEAETAPALPVETAAERRSSATLEMVAVERLQQYSWTTLQTGVMLR